MAESHLNPSRSSLTKQEQEDLNKRLYEAAEAGRTEDVVQLIKSGADVNYEFFLTVLGIASLKCHTETVMTLLQLGADLEKRDGFGSTAFLWSCRSGDLKCCTFLAQVGADLKATNGDKNTAVHYGCMSGSIDVVQFVLNQGGLSLQDTDEFERTGLHYSCQEGHLELIKWLIDQGLSLDTPDMFGTTPLDELKNPGYSDAIKERKKKCLDYLKGRTEDSDSTGSPSTDSKGDIESEDSPSTDSKGDIKSDAPGDRESRTPTPQAPSNGEGRASNTKDDQKMAQLVQKQIKKKGGMELRNVKGILIGSPGVGKTVTINQLTGKMRNISLDGHMKSTGVDKPIMFHLTEKKSIVIGKCWSPLTLDEQLGILFHCMSEGSHSGMEEESDTVFKASHGLPKVAKQLSLQSVPYQSIPTPAEPSINPIDAYFNLLQEFIRQSKWNTVQFLLESVKDTTLFHVIDTGGQPEFFEILPLLLRGPCFSLIFLNLAHPLKEPFQVTYRDTPTSHSLVEYSSTYTQLEMVHMLLASVHSLNSRKEFSQRSAAFMIATHLDEAKLADIQQVAKEIEDSLKGKSFHDEGILAKYYCLEKKVHTFLYALDNLNGDEKEVSILQEILTNLIKSIFPAEYLPTSWGVFHLMLRHKYEEKGLCTVQESEILGKACGLLEENEVEMALKFFHNRFGTILYYPEVEGLQSIVICDPNLLFRPITTLVAESFGANAVSPDIAEKIRQTGEISYNFFEQVCVQNDPLQRIPTKAIIDLLKYHNIVTEIGNGDKRLFMSCLLRPSPPAESGNLSPIDPASLLFTFHPHGYQPICLFHVLVSKLLQSKKFLLDDIRYRNKIDFLYGGAEVQILSRISFLEVRVKNCSQNRYVRLKKLLLRELDGVIAEVPHMEGTKVNISFYCPNSIDGDGSPHIATLYECEDLFEGEPSRLLRCVNCKGQRAVRLQAHHEVWFEDCFAALSETVGLETCTKPGNAEGVTIDNSSSLQMQLEEAPKIYDAFKITASHSIHWKELGRELRVPYNYREQLRSKIDMSDEDKLEAVLNRWIESQDVPVTWLSLIEALKEIHLADVAKKVKDFVVTKNR